MLPETKNGTLPCMMKELKSLLERAARWPQGVQKEAVETLLSIEQGHVGSYELTAEDRKALARSAKDVRRKKFVPPRKVTAFFKSVSA